VAVGAELGRTHTHRAWGVWLRPHGQAVPNAGYDGVPLADALPADHIVQDGLREEDNNGGGPEHQVRAGDVHKHARLAAHVGLCIHGWGVWEAVSAYA
jgi:hypothetical protein